MGVALLAAVLFDRVENLQWVMLTLAVVAAAVAAVLYFYNTDAESTIHDSKSPESLALQKIEWHHPARMHEQSVLARMLDFDDLALPWAELLDRPETIRQLTYMLVFSKSQQEEFNKRIAHALSPLYESTSTREIEMECVVTRTGNFVFVVRHVNKQKRPLPPTFATATQAKTSGEWKIRHKIPSVIVHTPVEIYNS